jgi:ubiquinone/menaquinone biosynthesis C-methylase UbiE
MHRDPEGKEKQIIAELLGSSAGDVLEIGCGDGRLTRELADICGTLTALDPELSSIIEANAFVSERARFLTGSGEDLPLVDDCADTVVFSLSLHHQNPVKALDEARRVMREDGRILVLEPVEHSLLTMLFAFLDDESGEYERAEVAIDCSGLKELRSGSVRTRWVFENFTEMTDYFFDYMGLESDPEKEEGMAQLLGERRDLEPLHIEDITRFWLLQENPLKS